MNRLFKPVAVLLCFCFALSGCERKETPKKVSLYGKGAEISEPAEPPSRDTLWFGFDLRLDPKEDVNIYAPFLKYLEAATGKQFRIKFADNYEKTVEDLGTGVTHFAAVGTLSYVIGESKYDIRYLVSAVNREGDTTYHSVIFTVPKSAVQRIQDLRGKCFAFGSQMSTQGHLIPRKMLEDEGIGLKDLGRYVYTGSHIDTVKAVLNGECDAGGIQDTLASQLAAEQKIRILAISGPYPSSLIAYNSSVDSKTVEAVRMALLALEPMGKHRDMLVNWEKTEMPMGFTKVDEPEILKVKELAVKYGLLMK